MRITNIATGLLLTLLTVATFVSSALSAGQRHERLASVEQHFAPPNDAPIAAEPEPVDISGRASELMKRLLGLAEIFATPIRNAHETVDPALPKDEADSGSSEDEKSSAESGDAESGFAGDRTSSDPADGGNRSNDPASTSDELAPPPTGGVAPPAGNRPDDVGGSRPDPLDAIGAPDPQSTDGGRPAIP